MTIKELALEWIQNDRTGDYCNRKITAEESTNFVNWMDPDVLEALTEDITPESFMDSWNSIIEEDKIMTTKRISLDNGNTFLTAGEAIPEILSRNLWDDVVNMMDDGARETVSAELAPCTEEEFLTRYLEIAPENLIIG